MKSHEMTEFLDQLYNGGEVVFLYHDKKYFVQGWTEGEMNHVVLDEVNSEEFKGYLWRYAAKSMKECADMFLEAHIWEDKSFKEIWEDVIWADWE